MNQSPKNIIDVDNQKKQKIDANTNELIKSMFLEVSDNQDVPNVFRNILAKLLDRYVSIALATPNLFAIENHQARVFLKETCILCIKWKNEEDLKSLFLKKLELAVEKIIANDTYDSKLFIKYQNDLGKVLIKLRKRAEVKIKRSNEKLLGQKKIEQAQKSITLALNEKFIGEKPPIFVKDILEGEWMNVLVLLHVRHGNTSIEYQSRLNFVDMLVECLQLKGGHSKQQLELLTKEYQEGLALVAFNQQEISTKQDALIANITNLHQLNISKTIVKPKVKSKVAKPKQKQPEILKAKKKSKVLKKIEKSLPEKKSKTLENINKPKIKSKVVKPRTVESEFTESAVAKPKTKQNQPSILKAKKKSKVLKKVEMSLPKKKPKALEDIKEQAENIIDYRKIVASLKTGIWFEIIDGNNKVKAKLSWISPITGNLLFVDSQGLKITDKTSFELETELESQSFKILSGID